MSCMQLPSRLKQFSTMRLCEKYRPFWLRPYVFPKYTLLDMQLNNQVALILYYAQVMDQKKLLIDFFRLCKDSFENKCDGKVLESSVKSWIKHSIVKLHRRREQIISNAITTFHIEMIGTMSQILLSIFCNLLRESSDNVSYLNTLSKKRIYGDAVTSHSVSTFFSASRVLPRISKSKDVFECISEWDHWFLCLPFQENKNLAVSVSNNNPVDWLRKFWLTFCYQPDPTNSIYNADTTVKSTSFSHTSECYISKNMTVFNRISENCSTIKTTDFNQSYIPLKLTRSILKKHNANHSIENDQSMFPHESEEDTSVSTLLQEDSGSSDSWSSADLADEMSEELNFNDVSMSPGIRLNQDNPTLLWLQSSSDVTDADFDSDESVIFKDVITEENCLERGGTNGSLYFIDTDEDDDFDVMFSKTSAVLCPIDIYEDKSQAYDNPCFEDEFGSHRVSKFIKTVNESWNEMMLGIEDKPRRASKVCFAPEPGLVTIHCFEKTEENSFDSSAILDRMRFQRRIMEFNQMLAPFLTLDHRKEIERRNCFYQD